MKKEGTILQPNKQPDVGKKLFHLFIKAGGVHRYYGSIKALIDHNGKDILGVSDSTLYHYDWQSDYENEKIIVRKNEMLTTGDVKKTVKPPKKATTKKKK